MAQAEATANFDEVYIYVDTVNSNLVGFPILWSELRSIDFLSRYVVYAGKLPSQRLPNHQKCLTPITVPQGRHSLNRLLPKPALIRSAFGAYIKLWRHLINVRWTAHLFR